MYFSLIDIPLLYRQWYPINGRITNTLVHQCLQMFWFSSMNVYNDAALLNPVKWLEIVWKCRPTGTNCYDIEMRKALQRYLRGLLFINLPSDPNVESRKNYARTAGKLPVQIS